MAKKTRDERRTPFFLKPIVSALSGRRIVQVYMKLASPIDRRLIPLTNGRLSTGVGEPVLVMETVGANSGKKRRTPLLYMRDGDNIVVVASYGGSSSHPSWNHNVKANPRVRVLGQEAQRPVHRGRRPGRRARASLGRPRPVLRRLRQVPDLHRPRNPDLRPHTGARSAAQTLTRDPLGAVQFRTHGRTLSLVHDQARKGCF